MYHNETKCFREKNRKRSQNSHSIALFSLKNMRFLITSRALWTTSGMKRTIGGDRGLQKDMKVRSHQTMWGLGPHLVTKGSCKPRREDLGLWVSRLPLRHRDPVFIECALVLT